MPYDFFLCHASSDAPSVHALYERLARRGRSLYLADVGLHSEAVSSAAEHALAEARVLCLILSGGVSRDFWQSAPVQAVLSQQASQRVSQVIVDLTGAELSQLPAALSVDTVLDGSDGDWERLADALLAQLPTGTGRVKAARPTPRQPERASPPTPRRTIPVRAQAYRLNISLARDGEQVVARHSLATGQVLPTTRTDWSVLEAARQQQRALASTPPELLSEALTVARGQLGRCLFQVLFGDDPSALLSVMRSVFSAPQPTPLYGPVRVHIHATDRSLDITELPWRWLSWRAQPLLDCGWRVYTSVAETPQGDHTVHTPMPVLAIISDVPAGDVQPVRGHAQAVRELLAKLFLRRQEASYLRIASDRAAIVAAIGELPPELVYIHAAAHPRGDRLLLKSGSLTLADLAGIFRECNHVPRVLYCNTVGTPLTRALPDADVPLVLWRTLPTASARTTAFALEWLQTWLTEGGDPLDALHESARSAGLGTCPEAATVAVSASYRHCNAHPVSAPGQTRSPLLYLDRDEPKAMIVKHLRELAQSPNRRVLAVVAYAEAGNLLSELWDQLRHEIDIQGERVLALAWKRVRLPPVRHQLRLDLEAELPQQLHAEPGESLSHLLRKHAPRDVGTARRILWLNWGVYGPDRHSLTPAQLGEYLHFVSQYLVSQCPGDLRLVSYLALETRKPGGVGKVLDKLRSQPFCQKPAFRLDDLTVGRVEHKHIANYLGDYTDCEPNLHLELARRVLTQSGGHFQEAVRLLDVEARGGSWYDLLTALRTQQDQQDDFPDDDEPL